MPSAVRGPRPGPLTEGPRFAASQSSSHGDRQGPRMVNPYSQPPLPRAVSAVSWASSETVAGRTEAADTEALEAAERDDKFPDSFDDGAHDYKAKMSLDTEARIAAEQGDTFPDSFQDNVQVSGSPVKPARMKRGWSNIVHMFGNAPADKKGSLRKSWTGQSFASNASSNAKSSMSQTSNPLSSSQSNSSQCGTNTPVLKKGASRMSFASWRSGSKAPSEQTDSTGARARSKAGLLQKVGSKISLGSKIWTRASTDDELVASKERQVMFDTERVVVKPQALNDRNSSQPNKVRTSRFTLLTWLPKSLFMQFQRVANMYFLLIVVLVGFPWSPKDWKSKVFPFAGVLLWTALKDLHEDRQRRRDDDLENHQKTWRFDIGNHKFVPTMWADVFCGDVLLVMADEAFAADCILLHAGGSYEAYISTISLDGETNLKERRPPRVVDGLIEELAQDVIENKNLTKQYMTASITEAEDEAMVILHLLHTWRLAAKMGAPEAAVQDVKGSLSCDRDESICPLNASNLLPRGCTLRNTAFILALVVYVGDETKTRLNTAQSKPKVSNMQKYLNLCIWGLLIGLGIICLYSATASVIKSDAGFEFCCSDESWLIKLAVFLITFYHVVPMSLYVVFEMLKLLLGYRVNVDPQMICPETDAPAMARTTDLIEEMGQVNFVFSDKTGTLTRNEMVFAHACVDGVDLGDFRRHAGSSELPSGIDKVLHMFAGSSSSSSLVANVMWFFTCLAVCHSVQVQLVEAPVDGRQQRYIGVSPDEVALVEAAREVNITFTSRIKQVGPTSSSSSQVILMCGTEGRLQRFSVLYELEFNSDRKRMSVVCQYENRIFCITKGADNVMEQLTVEPLSVQSKLYLKRFSQQGFRTLVVAAKKVSPEYYAEWEARYVAALSTLDDSKAAKVDEVAAEMETSLFTVGITAVEDRLQHGVPKAIDTIKQAGVRVWVLTGDKTETAVDIAKSCMLFRDNTHLVYATEVQSTEEALLKLCAANKALQGVMDGGLVLDGRTVQYSMGDDECESLIYELGLASCSCVCCRLTPLQKRQLVELVRRRNPSAITLAIGDGANDVPMIEGAHLGIAIRGKEGAQAVQVSDVAISQFRFLVPLLMCHGRRAYRNVAVFLCFYLYKNLALAMGDIVWMHQDGYAGRIAYPEYLSINFNFLFTSWHILFVLGYDYDVTDEEANVHPELYAVGPRRDLFNMKVFSLWVACAVYQGCVAWLVPNLWFGGTEYEKKEPVQFWVGSSASFTVVCLVVMLKLIISVCRPCRLISCILPTLGALFLYVVVLICLSYTSMGVGLQPSMEKIPEELFKQADAIISMVAVPAATASVDLFAKILRTKIWPSAHDAVMRRK